MFIEGYIAYTGGHRLVHNPYCIGTYEYIEWRRGWYSAHHESLEKQQESFGKNWLNIAQKEA